ncbi:hypothetical protein BST81_15410 [Leptolyngbya sp. 'hensonii']|uniref:PAS domain-containing sensor histidine kinase n=1 Tax=Leptolyngbya sp. 'hensonii' TaxID=1922337 RepID=UPI00094F6A4B|nr:PAS domain-containing sensor histidine kinase [Leptolyngbya sp. 'hensonii']OLP17704.1 hypothetical protein BST81_15410 [Leptolyngbya sp. 'hensonii']
MLRLLRLPNLALSIALGYAFVSSLWIAFSDDLLKHTVPDIDLLTQLQTIKGWGFVLFSSIILYGIIQAAIRRLNRNHQLLQTIVNSIPDAVFVKDRQGRYLIANARLAYLMNRPPYAILGKSDADFLLPQEANQIEASDQEVFQTGCAAEVEYQLMIQGQPRWFLVSKALCQTPDGHVIGLVSISREITHRKQIQQALENFNQELEAKVQERTQSLLTAQVALQQQEQELRRALAAEQELNELRSRFVSTVSHEFRTPLTVITTATKLLEQFYEQTPIAKRRDYFHKIRQAIQALTQLLDDLLLIGQAEAGRLSFNPAPLDFHRLCQERVESLTVSEPDRTILMTYQGDKVMPLDEKLVDHILTNLLSNALKYSAPDQTVHLFITIHPDQILIQVRDQGIGIAPEEQSRLFESFHRCSNVGKVPGTGLGLSIVKHCVDLHQGTIIVDSTLDQGSTFTVTLPRVQASLTPSPPIIPRS